MAGVPVLVSQPGARAAGGRDRGRGAAAASAISVSHRITQEWREYERTSTTVVNAYVLPIVGPLSRRVRSRLGEPRLPAARLLITQSNGGAFSLEAARVKPVHTIESGPAAGAIGCAASPACSACDRLISFDMGGTTAKCAIVRARRWCRPPTSTTSTASRCASRSSTSREVSAGGGTIAWIDAGGALDPRTAERGRRAGSRLLRAGAAPSRRVTDANVVLGRIDGRPLPRRHDAARRAGGSRRGRRDSSRAARPARASTRAAGVVRLADVKMALAVRSITAERGLDPRDYALVAYGGGGPLTRWPSRASWAFRAWSIPPAPSTFSAWGMLATDLRHDLVRTVLEPLERTDAAWAEARYRGDGARDRGDPAAGRGPARHPARRRSALSRPGAHGDGGRWRSVDDWDGAAQAASTTPTSAPTATRRPTCEVQLLNLRLTVVFPLAGAAASCLEPPHDRRGAASRRARSTRRCAGDVRRVPRVPARRLRAGRRDRGAGRHRGGRDDHHHRRRGDTPVGRGPRLPDHPRSNASEAEAVGGASNAPRRVRDASLRSITVGHSRRAQCGRRGVCASTMIKTAYNHIISESLDFGCAIFDPDVQMIAQGIGLPVFQGHLGFPIEATISDRGLEAFREGDVFIHNDPYAGNGNHLNDVADDRAGVLGGPADRLRVGEGALERRRRAGAELHAGGLAPSSARRACASSRCACSVAARLNERGDADHPRQHPHRERHAEGHQAMIAVCRAGEASLPRGPRQVRPRRPCSTPRASTWSSPSGARAPALATIPAGVYRAVGALRQRRHHARPAGAGRDGDHGGRRRP